jgi:hypothetical protein
MTFELSMSTDWHLSEAISRLEAQGIDARIGPCGLDYPHVLAISGVKATQEGLVRGWVLQLDPDAERVLRP